MKNKNYKFEKKFLNEIPTEILEDLIKTINEVVASRKMAKYIFSASKKGNVKYLDINSPESKSYFDNLKHKYVDDKGFLFKLLDEKWCLPSKKYDLERKYYVYMHYDLDGTKLIYRSECGNNGILFWHTPFYIGKGTGDRRFNKKRSTQHKLEIERMEKADPSGTNWNFKFKDNLTEYEAVELEAKLILFFGIKHATINKPHLSGLKTGCLLNNEYPFIPFDYKSTVK